MVLVSSRQSSRTCSLSPSDNVENRDQCVGGSSTPSSSLCLIDLDMMEVNNPSYLVPQLAKHSSIGSIKRDPMPLFQRSGSTVNGPKKPTLPQLVAKLEPTSLPSTSAPKAASGAANQRVRT